MNAQTVKHTPGPWIKQKDPNAISQDDWCIGIEGAPIDYVATCSERDSNLIAAAPTQHAEMLRYLPIIERAEADPKLWAQLTEGTGIATANGYRAAIAKATGEKP